MASVDRAHFEDVRRDADIASDLLDRTHLVEHLVSDEFVRLAVQRGGARREHACALGAAKRGGSEAKHPGLGPLASWGSLTST